MNRRARTTSRRNRRGAIFIIALTLIVMLSALLLVYSQEMRTELVSSGNRLSSAQADGVEQGAEQWVLAQLEANIAPLPATGTSSSSGSASAASAALTAVDPTTIPAEAVQVGKGYFWILRPDFTQDQTYSFGIMDESGKLNLNGASATALMSIPGMTQDLANSINAWPASAAPTGTKLTYESVEEVLLADVNLTPQVLFGYDLNHDGVIDADEQAAANGAAVTDGITTDSRGMFNFLTVYSTVAQPSAAGTTVSTARAKKTIGLINVNTAPLEVLMTIPGMTQSDASSLISKRTTTPQTGTAWVGTTLSAAKLTRYTPYIAGKSYQYSADIVAVSGDGRAFKRIRIVVDARTTPAKIVYRKDLTSLGWPLPADVRASMRSGKGVPPEVTGTTNQESGTGLTP